MPRDRILSYFLKQPGAPKFHAQLIYVKVQNCAEVFCGRAERYHIHMVGDFTFHISEQPLADPPAPELGLNIQFFNLKVFSTRLIYGGRFPSGFFVAEQVGYNLVTLKSEENPVSLDIVQSIFMIAAAGGFSFPILGKGNQQLCDCLGQIHFFESHIVRPVNIRFIFLLRRKHGIYYFNLL